MFVGSRFEGDSDQELMLMQHEDYWLMLGTLQQIPRDRYLDAARLLRVEDELCRRLREMKGFDHRVLQDAHDLIAGEFRFRSRESAQLALGESVEEHRERWRAAWQEFFTAEVQELSRDDEFTRMVCVGVVYGLNGEGLEAEPWLRRHLRRRYAGWAEKRVEA